jgi:hypothetical protein
MHKLWTIRHGESASQGKSPSRRFLTAEVALEQAAKLPGWGNGASAF